MSVTRGVPKAGAGDVRSYATESGHGARGARLLRNDAKKEPNRLGATVGAAKAAEQSGDAAKARVYYGKVVALTEGADPVRPEIAVARAFMSAH